MCMYTQRGNIEHVKIGEGEAFYGHIPASPLTKEQLLSALADIQRRSKSNMDHLFEIRFEIYDYEEFDRVPEEEAERLAAEKSASELYSDELLKALNDDMTPLYVAFSDIIDSDAEIMKTEGFVGHGIEIMGTVHDKPAACVGTRFVSGGGMGGYTTYCQICTYIDIDGGVITVKEYTVLDGSDDVIMGGRELVESDEDLSLDLMESYFPEQYQGFWDV